MSLNERRLLGLWLSTPGIAAAWSTELRRRGGVGGQALLMLLGLFPLSSAERRIGNFAGGDSEVNEAEVSFAFSASCLSL